jgi:hypothetical protein
MRRARARRLAAVSRRPASWLALAAAVAALSACGSDDEGTIPPDNADALRAELEQVEQAQAEGLCENAQAAAIRFRTAVDQLGADVDREVKGALQQGADRLVELSQDPNQCGVTGATGEQQETDAGSAEEQAPPVQTPPEEPSTDEPPTDEDGRGNGPPGGEPPGQSGDDGDSDRGNGSGGTGSGKDGD